MWWLQTPTAFADLRVPNDANGEADSFAGHTTWAGPRLTWHRHLDLHGRPDADTGTITWDGDDMLEEGVFGFAGQEAVRYRERWRRLVEPGGAGYLALRNDTGRLVCVGNYALTVVDDRGAGGGYRATAWQRPSVLWAEVMAWPAGHDGVSQPPDDTGVWQVGDSVRLDDGTAWTVEEVGAARPGAPL